MPLSRVPREFSPLKLCILCIGLVCGAALHLHSGENGQAGASVDFTHRSRDDTVDVWFPAPIYGLNSSDILSHSDSGGRALSGSPANGSIPLLRFLVQLMPELAPQEILEFRQLLVNYTMDGTINGFVAELDPDLAFEASGSPSHLLSGSFSPAALTALSTTLSEAVNYMEPDTPAVFPSATGTVYTSADVLVVQGLPPQDDQSDNLPFSNSSGRRLGSDTTPSWHLDRVDQRTCGDCMPALWRPLFHLHARHLPC